MSVPNTTTDTAPETEVERREFLGRAGRYAAVTPPLITMMLSASTVPAYASGSAHTEVSPESGVGDPGGSAPSTQPANAPGNRHQIVRLNNPDERPRTEAGDKTR